MKKIISFFYNSYFYLLGVLLSILFLFPPKNKSIIDIVSQILILLLLMFTILDLVYLRKKYKKKVESQSKLDKKLFSDQSQQKFEKDIRDNLN